MIARLRERLAAAAAIAGDASARDRAQAAAAAVLVAAVVGGFAYGAATHDDGGAPRFASLAGEQPRAQGDDRARGDRRRSGGKPPLLALPRLTGGGVTTPATAAPKTLARRPVGDRPRGDKPEHRKPKRGRRPVAGQAPPARTPVVLGIAYQPADERSAPGAADLGDDAAQARAVAAWVNAHNGVSGRPLELRMLPFDPSVRGFEPAFADVCKALDADALRPLAVIARPENAEAQTGCLAPRGLPLIGDGPAVADSELFTRAGDHLFAPGSMALDRLAATYVRVLAREGFLRPGDRVGVLRLAGEEFERADRGGLRPALARAGVGVAAVAELPRGASVLDAPVLLARATEAALRFRLARVNRVLALDAGRATPAFLSAAEALGYRPRYGLNSTMVPAALPGRVRAAQLEGALGAGFAPLLDVAGEREPEQPASRRQCETIYDAAGIELGPRTVDGHYQAIAICDAILLVRAALEDGAEITAAGLAAAIERLGDDRPSALALATRLGPDRHDGATALRTLRYDRGCACIEYFGAPEVVP